MIFQRISSIGISNVMAAEENAMLGWFCYLVLTIVCLSIQVRAL